MLEIAFFLLPIPIFFDPLHYMAENLNVNVVP